MMVPGYLLRLGRNLLRERTRRALRFDLIRLCARMKHRAQGAVPSHALLHLGCGQRRMAGFLNVDALDSDYDVDLACGTLPWGSSSFDAVVSQQVIEHLELQSELRPLLSEILRVLRPGGEVWLSCPDMESVCRGYIADRGRSLLEDRRQRWPTWSLAGTPPQHMVNLLFHQGGGHVNLFDYELLIWLLEQVGFVECARVNEADLRRRFPTVPPRRDDAVSLYVRALKVPHTAGRTESPR